MNLKTLYITTGVLALLAAVTYFVKNSDSSLPADPRIGETLIDATDLGGVERIQIETGATTLSLDFDAAAGKWLLQERHALPVDMSSLGRIITQMTEARVERLVSANPERVSELGFGESSVSFIAPDGSTVAGVQLGRLTDTGKQLVKYEGEDKAFLINDQISLQSDPTSWLDKELLSIESQEIRRISIDLENGESLAVERAASDGDWTAAGELPAGKELDQAALNRAINRFTNLRFTDLRDLESEEVQAARENGHEIAMTLEDETEYRFQVGRRPEVRVTREVESVNDAGEATTETEEEVETPAGPAILEVRSSKVEDPINAYMAETAFEVSSSLYTALPRTIDGLLQDAPEPEPEPESDPESPEAPTE